MILHRLACVWRVHRVDLSLPLSSVRWSLFYLLRKAYFRSILIKLNVGEIFALRAEYSVLYVFMYVMKYETRSLTFSQLLITLLVLCFDHKKKSCCRWNYDFVQMTFFFLSVWNLIESAMQLNDSKRCFFFVGVINFFYIHSREGSHLIIVGKLQI